MIFSKICLKCHAKLRQRDNNGKFKKGVSKKTL